MTTLKALPVLELFGPAPAMPQGAAAQDRQAMQTYMTAMAQRNAPAIMVPSEDSLLIIVGVMLDTMRQVESHLLMRHYDGFLRKGKLRGRR